MKVLFVYNSSDAQSVAGAVLAMSKYSDITLKDINGVLTAAITTWIGTLSAVYDLILVGWSVKTAGTGVISPAQQILLDAKISKTALWTGTATASASNASLTDANSGWTVDAYAGKYVKTTGGTGLNQVLQIESNTSQVLTLESAWGVAIDNTTTFEIVESREDESYYIPATSGHNKRAYCSWVHEKLYEGVDVPLFIAKLAGDKNTNTAAINAQGVLDESYITYAVKYFLRDLTDADVVDDWNKLLFNMETPVSGRKQTKQDMALYTQMYKYGKLLVESANAHTVTL